MFSILFSIALSLDLSFGAMDDGTGKISRRCYAGTAPLPCAASRFACFDSYCVNCLARTLKTPVEETESTYVSYRINEIRYEIRYE